MLEPLTALHKRTLLIAAAAAPFQTSQAPAGAPRHQPASTCSTAPSPAHPVKLRAQTTVPASTPGPPQPPPQASHPAGQSTLPQGLVLTSQAHARLPSKWPHRSGLPRRHCDEVVFRSACGRSPLSTPFASPGPTPGAAFCHAVISALTLKGKIPVQGQCVGPCLSLSFLLVPTPALLPCSCSALVCWLPPCP